MTELVITKLGHLGDGLSEGIAVPGALPGETVAGEIEGGILAAPKIVTPSADRVKPPCPHAKSCGGCVIQHGSDRLVAEWKRGIVLDALRSQGVAAEVGLPVTSPGASRRRAGFAGRRTKKGALVGFHGPRSHTLIEVPGCLVVTPKLAALRPHLEAMVIAGGSRKGEISFQATETLNGPDVAAKGGKALDLALHQELVAIGAAAGLARLSWNGEQVAQWAAPEIRLGPARVTLPPGAFLEPSAGGGLVRVEQRVELPALRQVGKAGDRADPRPAIEAALRHRRLAGREFGLAHRAQMFGTRGTVHRLAFDIDRRGDIVAAFRSVAGQIGQEIAVAAGMLPQMDMGIDDLQLRLQRRFRQGQRQPVLARTLRAAEIGGGRGHAGFLPDRKPSRGRRANRVPVARRVLRVAFRAQTDHAF
ncbi:class I SAM-dependent RNA methyltransferase [Mangrovicoccus ximenensis]|uniref:class I SAM-dependent RNA methyltransferase n=1 Tax=Mangrovicoccus ximenensis TaxID=1911570 RepID=UPI000D39E25C|nr:class I SAM-dependent RNA methyltransferase [Mangrovicoccus ximenensis]